MDKFDNFKKMFFVALVCFGFFGCGDNCVTCKTPSDEIEYCDDLNYTNQEGAIISFDDFIESQRLLGAACD